MHEWMQLQRKKITDGSATAKELDYSLRRWSALTRFLDDGQLPIDNNWIENKIRPIAIGRKKLVICGLPAGRPACGCGHEPDSKRQAQRDRPLRLPQGCAAAPAHAPEQSDCRAAGAPVAANTYRCLITRVSARIRVKACLPCAYASLAKVYVCLAQGVETPVRA